jgi:transposase-like protein
MGRPSRFSPEVRARAIRLVMEQRPAHPSEWAALQAVATRLGTMAETLRKLVRQAERDTGFASCADGSIITSPFLAVGPCARTTLFNRGRHDCIDRR